MRVATGLELKATRPATPPALIWRHGGGRFRIAILVARGGPICPGASWQGRDARADRSRPLDRSTHTAAQYAAPSSGGP
jgi:hypothetical protein